MHSKLFLSIFILFFSLVTNGQNKWTNYTNKDNATCIAIEGAKVWIGSTGGLICRDTSGNFIAEYTKNDGLAGIEISSILIDNKGNKWITFDSLGRSGISKYDGLKWTTYNIEGFADNGAISAATDNHGDIWFGSWHEGVSKFDGVNWKTYNSTNSGLVNNTVYAIAIDSHDNKWFATGGGVSKFDGTNWTTYTATNSGLDCNFVRSIVIDAQGDIWLGIPGEGINKFDGTNWITYNISNSGLLSNFIYSIAIDSEGNKWILTSEGLNKFDGKNWTSHNGYNSGLLFATSLAIDIKGNKWLGFYGGVCKFNEITKRIFKSSDTGIAGNHVTTLAIDTNGDKWFAVDSGWVCKFTGTSWTTYNSNNSRLIANHTNSLVVDGDGNKWIGTDGGVYKFDNTNWTIYKSNNSGLVNNYVSSIAIDINGDCWYATNGGVSKFDGTNWVTYNIINSGLISNYITSIAIDAQGNKWFGSYDGVCKFDGLSWTIFNTNNSGLANNYVFSIGIDAEGNKWFGGSDGVSKFNGITWATYNSKNSVLIGSVLGIAIDIDGNKWFGSENGVTKFDGINWTTFNANNSGLTHDKVKPIIIDSQGNKWFGGYSGVSKFEDGGSGPFDRNKVKCIYGSVFSDLNSNGVKDNGEPLLPYKYVKVTNDSTIATTQDDGRFCITRTKGIYTIKFVPCPNWKLTTDSSITIEIKDTTKQITGVDFGIKPLNNINDVSVDLTGGIARAGFDVNYWLTCKNNGNQPTSGEISLEIPSLVTFVSSKPMPNVKNGNKLSWNYSNLVSLQQEQIFLILKMPDVSHLRDTVITKASITQILSDTIPTNNTSLLRQVLVGSYDPNDKSVDTGLANAGNTCSKDELTYTIRFQNMGTDTAFNIVIRDTMNRNLNIESFRLVSSSHHVKINMKNKNVVSFIFNGIKLPDDKTNEAGSHGFVKYAIKPFTNLADNTEIKNTGYIYFDFNPPIATNEVKSAFKFPPALSVSTDKLNIGAKANSKATCEIESNVNWELSSNQSWLTLSPALGINGATITISASANTASTPRTSVITIKGKGVPSKTITVTQAGNSDLLEVNVSRPLYIPPTENSKTSFDITSNVNWSITSNQDWLSVTPASGVNNATISLIASANPITDFRTAIITVSGAEVPSKTIIITQAAGNISILDVKSSGTSYIASTANSNATFSITANVNWDLTSDQSWLTLNPTTGKSNAIVVVNALANLTGASRMANVTISGSGVESKKFIVTQKAISTGVNDITDNDVSIYPIPVFDNLFISLSKRIFNSVVTIYSLSGVQLYSMKILDSVTAIDMSNFKSGLYFVKIITPDNGMVVKKIIKQ